MVDNFQMHGGKIICPYQNKTKAKKKYMKRLIHCRDNDVLCIVDDVIFAIHLGNDEFPYIFCIKLETLDLPFLACFPINFSTNSHISRKKITKSENVIKVFK